jgi:hypothetical protein
MQGVSLVLTVGAVQALAVLAPSAQDSAARPTAAPIAVKTTATGLSVSLLSVKPYADKLRIGSCPPGLVNTGGPALGGVIGHLGVAVRLRLRILPSYKGAGWEAPSAVTDDGKELQAVAVLPTMHDFSALRPGDEIDCEFPFADVQRRDLSLRKLTFSAVVFDLPAGQ